MLRPASPLIVPMSVSDLDAVVSIAGASFTHPWSREAFATELARDWSVIRVLRPSPGAAVAAFAALWVVRDEVHVLSIATHPAVRRRGYARLVMDDVLTIARARRVRWVTLEVARSNEPALTLYRGIGFAAIGVRPRYYVEDDEDAVVMLLSLDEHGRVEPRRDEPF